MIGETADTDKRTAREAPRGLTERPRPEPQGALPPRVPEADEELRAKGEEGPFFLNLQREYEDTEATLAQENLPSGGAQEILSAMYYPVDETPGRLDSPIM